LYKETNITGRVVKYKVKPCIKKSILYAGIFLTFHHRTSGVSWCAICLKHF